MSAFGISKYFRAIWRGMFGRPVANAIPVAAHLRSLPMADAAALLGAGSVPRSQAKPATAAAVTSQQVSTAIAELPLPIFRTTGTFETEHAQSDRALAERIASLVSVFEAGTSPSAATSAVQTLAAPNRTLAAQLAVVARLNSRCIKDASHKPGRKKQAKTVTTAAAVGLRARLAANSAKSIPAIRPQAVVIDLATAKVQRRLPKSKRAA